MKALVFAAGLGTRLGSITRDIPKAMVKVGGIPMLERVLVRLRDAGFSEVVVNACYKASCIEEFLAAGPVPGMNVHISREPGPEPFETGGGIKFARPLLHAPSPHPEASSCHPEPAEGSPAFLAHNADILTDLDLAWFAAQARPGALATLLVTDPKPADNRFFLFSPGDLRLVGWTNITTGEVRGQAPEGCIRMSFCGIHVISDAVFPLMESWPERFSITDFYIQEAARHPIYGVPAPAGTRILDIGSPAALAEADRLCR